MLSARIGPWFNGEAFDYQELTVDNTVRTLDAAKVAICEYAWFQVAGGTIRMTLHSVDPTTTFGIQIFDMEQFESLRRTVAKLRFIREGAVNGTIRAVYYR